MRPQTLKSGSLYLARTQTTRADRDGFMGSVHNGADLSDVGLPGSAGFAVGVGNIISERNALSAVHTFCHILHLPRFFGLSQTNGDYSPFMRHHNTVLIIIA